MILQVTDMDVQGFNANVDLPDADGKAQDQKNQGYSKNDLCHQNIADVNQKHTGYAQKQACQAIYLHAPRQVNAALQIGNLSLEQPAGIFLMSVVQVSDQSRHGKETVGISQQQQGNS